MPARRPLGGNAPVETLTKGNRLRVNKPDLFYDGSGSGNVFVHNSCETSIPLTGSAEPHAHANVLTQGSGRWRENLAPGRSVPDGAHAFPATITALLQERPSGLDRQLSAGS
jgi:hypothetical protein